jgi:choice-of-anchor C domain-containing protein
MSMSISASSLVVLAMSAIACTVTTSKDPKKNPDVDDGRNHSSEGGPTGHPSNDSGPEEEFETTEGNEYDASPGESVSHSGHPVPDGADTDHPGREAGSGPQPSGDAGNGIADSGRDGETNDGGPGEAAVDAGASEAGRPMLPEGESLILNGSFESASVDPGATWALLQVGDTRISNWEVAAAPIHYTGTYWPGSDGSRSIDLDGLEGQPGAVQQVVPTQPSHHYLVTFDLAGNAEHSPTIKPLRVVAASQSADFFFDSSGRSPQDMGWTTQSFTFTADDTTVTLEFQSLNPPAEAGWGAVIDNIAMFDLTEAP